MLLRANGRGKEVEELIHDPWFEDSNPDMAVSRRENIAEEKLVVKELARLDHGCLYYLVLQFLSI